MGKAVAKRWDYEKSVTKVKPLVMKWGTLSIEMLGELHAAREALSVPPQDARIVGQMSRDERRTWADYCTDVGLEKRTANRWLKMYDPERRKLLQAPEAHVSHNSGDNEWYTPPEYTSAVKEVLGSIDLDPASTEMANEQIGAATYYTKEDDGREHPWEGRVWMNPPYAQPECAQFCAKLLSEYRAGTVTEAIVLVNDAMETDWLQALLEAASALCFPDGRLKFWAPDKSTSAPLQGQVLLYFGDRAPVFVERFRNFGKASEWSA